MAWVLGVLRQPSGALSAGDGSRRARPAPRRPKQGPLRLAALRGRLDALSRSRGAGGGDVPEPVASAERSGAMSSRATVFASIRRSLGVTGDEATRRFEVETRLKQAPPESCRSAGKATSRPGSRRSRPRRSAPGERHRGRGNGRTRRGKSPGILRESNCPATLRMGDDPRLAGMPWGETTLDILRGPSDGRDLNAVSAAFAGIAETGRWRSSPARTIRRPSIFCPTTTLWSCRARRSRRLRERVRQAAVRLWQGRSAPHPQFYHRPLAIGRYRADASPRRSRASAAAYRRRRLKLGRRRTIRPLAALTAC